MTFQADRITSIPAPLPTDYDRQFSFSDWERNSPGVPYPASGLEAEFNAIELSLDETQARLRLIQRDDGALANASVGPDQLTVEALVGVNPPTDWAAFTSYVAGDSVIFDNSAWYYCLESHVANPDFNVDLTAGRWRLLLDFTGFFTTEAEHWAIYPEDQLVPEGNGVDEYSAFHYSRKASDFADTAGGHASDAEGSATAAANAAATLNLPAPTTTDRIIVGNGVDGFVYGAQVTGALTGNVIPLRTAEGHLTTPTPTADAHAATKLYVDNSVEAIPEAGSNPSVFQVSTLGGIDLQDRSEENDIDVGWINGQVYLDTNCYQKIRMVDAVDTAAEVGDTIQFISLGGMLELDFSASSATLVLYGRPDSEGVPFQVAMTRQPWGALTIKKITSSWWVVVEEVAQGAQVFPQFSIPDTTGEDVGSGDGPFTAATSVTVKGSGEVEVPHSDISSVALNRWWSTPAAPGNPGAPSGHSVRITAHDPSGVTMMTGTLTEGTWYTLTEDRQFQFEKVVTGTTPPVETQTEQYTVEIRDAGSVIVSRGTLQVQLSAGNEFA